MQYLGKGVRKMKKETGQVKKLKTVKPTDPSVVDHVNEFGKTLLQRRLEEKRKKGVPSNPFQIY
jgi:hypothetical protein